VDDDLPVVSLGLLAREPECGERIARTLEGARGDGPANARWSVAQRIRGDVRLAHTEMRVPLASHFPNPTDLRTEQQTQYRAAANGYLELFGDRAACVIDVGRSERTFPELGIRLAAAVGILLRTVTGDLELRKLDVSDRPARVDDSLAFAVALLAEDWRGAERVHVISSDLLALDIADTWVDCSALAPQAAEWLAGRVATLRERADERRVIAGGDCSMCSHIWNCPAHATARSASAGVR
jgi:hypothetical protein